MAFIAAVADVAVIVLHTTSLAFVRTDQQIVRSFIILYIHSLSSLFLWKVKECAPKYKNLYMTFTDQ